MHLTIAASVVLAVVIIAAQYYYPSASSFLSFAANTVLKGNTDTSADGREQRCLAFVKAQANRGDAVGVLNAIDKFGWTEDFLMNVGDAKGEILSKALKDASPSQVLEIGAYIGYSATRIGSDLKPGAHLTSVEFSPVNAAIARQTVDYAGLSDRVTFVEGTVVTVLKRYVAEAGFKAFDFVFIDHDKSLYLSDLKYLLAEGLIAEGATIVADNVLFPGAPQYRAFINSDARFRTVEHSSHVEYLPIPDIVTVSTYLGDLKR